MNPSLLSGRAQSVNTLNGLIVFKRRRKKKTIFVDIAPLSDCYVFEAKVLAQGLQPNSVVIINYRHTRMAP